MRKTMIYCGVAITYIWQGSDLNWSLPFRGREGRVVDISVTSRKGAWFTAMRDAGRSAAGRDPEALPLGVCGVHTQFPERSAGGCPQSRESNPDRKLGSHSLSSDSRWLHFLFVLHASMCSRGSVVVKALCYKPEGRRFETRWGELISSIYLMLPAWGKLKKLPHAGSMR
jgi:hypothetical protein